MTIAVLLNADPDTGRLNIVGALPVPATVDAETTDVAEWVFAQRDVDVVEVWDRDTRLSVWTAEEGPGTALPDGTSAALLTTGAAGLRIAFTA